jgi:glycosyltransferase involved in cell wall biosynthesis
VVLVSDYAYPTGGAEEFVRELLAGLKGTFDVELLTWSEDALSPEDVPVHTVGPFGDIRSAWEILDRADILLVVTSFNVRLLARLASDYLRAHRKPAVTVVQTSSHSRPDAGSTVSQERWLASLLQRSSAVVAASTAVKKALDPVRGLAAVHVIENAARLRASAVRERGRSRVSFIGRPVASKGYDYFCQLADDLRETPLRFFANTVSVPPPELHPGITYSYQLSDLELLEFFGNADLVVAPYRYADGLPLAILEAINVGVPVIGFDAPGVGDLLKRYYQLALPPSYPRLREAIFRWAAGELQVTPPTAGQVTEWPTQIAQYQTILLQAARETADR